MNVRDITVTDVRLDWNEYAAPDLVIEATLSGRRYRVTQEQEGDWFTSTVIDLDAEAEISQWDATPQEQEILDILNEAIYASWEQVHTILHAFRKTMGAQATSTLHRSARVTEETWADEVG